MIKGPVESSRKSMIESMDQIKVGISSVNFTRITFTSKYLYRTEQ